MPSTRILLKEKGLSQLYHERHHLKHPIPYPMEVKPIGKTLTQAEWEKFCRHYLNAKTQQNCERRQNGTVIFLGEGGLEALKLFQDKFKTRFHLRMACESKENAIEWLELANAKGINIEELHYKNSHGNVMLNDKETIQSLSIKH